MAFVQVVLRKLGRGSRAVVGRLVRAPRKGSVVVIEFSDGMHEYVTTPVKRVLRLAGREIFYIETVNSGQAQIGQAAQGGRGTLSGGTLEMSNVDLAAEFTNLIVAQRGFQANSRVITTSDEILQDLVNLKR